MAMHMIEEQRQHGAVLPLGEHLDRANTKLQDRLAVQIAVGGLIAHIPLLKYGSSRKSQQRGCLQRSTVCIPLRQGPKCISYHGGKKLKNDPRKNIPYWTTMVGSCPL